MTDERIRRLEHIARSTLTDEDIDRWTIARMRAGVRGVWRAAAETGPRGVVTHALVSEPGTDLVASTPFDEAMGTVRFAETMCGEWIYYNANIWGGAATGGAPSCPHCLLAPRWKLTHAILVVQAARDEATRRAQEPEPRASDGLHSPVDIG